MITGGGATSTAGATVVTASTATAAAAELRAGMVGAEGQQAARAASAQAESAWAPADAASIDARAGSLRPVVIGENMERVRAAANAFDADTYGGFDNVDGLTGSDLETARSTHNAAWIRARIAEGRRVIDIGPWEGNAQYPGVTKDPYSIELYESAGYQNVIRPYETEL